MKHGALQLAASLCRALRQRDAAMVAALLQEGANPNLVLPEGVAAMHLAAGLEQEDGIRQHFLRLLLQHGGDPNVRSAEGLTPLHVAASWGRTTCLRLLLAEGGDPHLEDQVGADASLPRKWPVGLATAAPSPKPATDGRHRLHCCATTPATHNCLEGKSRVIRTLTGR